MKSLIKTLLPLSCATLSAVPLTLVSCNQDRHKPEPENYIELYNYIPAGVSGSIPMLVSDSISLTEGIEYSCVINYSNWVDWDQRPGFSYAADSGGSVHSSWIEAKNVSLKNNGKWEIISSDNYQVWVAAGFLSLKSSFSSKLSHNTEIKIDIVTYKTAEFVFSCR